MTILELIVSQEVSVRLTHLAVSTLMEVLQQLVLMTRNFPLSTCLVEGEAHAPVDHGSPPTAFKPLSFAEILQRVKQYPESAIESLISPSFQICSSDLALPPLDNFSSNWKLEELPPQYFEQLLCSSIPDLPLEPATRRKLNIQLIAILIAIATALIYCRFDTTESDEISDTELAC